MMKRILLAALACAACRSEELPNQKTEPTASNESTTIVVREKLDAALPACTLHFASDAFAASPRATAAGTVRVEGDYTRTLANVVITPIAPATEWKGTFSGPRDALVDMVKQHICTTASVYALKAEGNKDPTKGPIVLTAYVMTPDEKADVDAFCNAYARAPGVADAGPTMMKDRVAMAWVEDSLTTTRWDGWRRAFAHELGDAFMRNEDTKELFTKRANELEAAAAALGTKCDTAAQWKKR